MLTLKAGKFYKDKANKVWCCFKVDTKFDICCQAFCVETETGRVEYFFLDGRYDADGLREHTLIEELDEHELPNL